MVVNDRWNGDWALYSGDEFIALGTIYEINEYTGIDLKYLKKYSTEWFQTHYPNQRALIKVEYEEEELL